MALTESVLQENASRQHMADNRSLFTSPYEETDAASDTDSSVNTGRDNCQPRDRKRSTLVAGAAVAGGVVGLVIASPLVAVVAAGGAAALATSKGKAGDVARATGNVTVNAGERLKKFDMKHRIVEKTSNGVVKGCNWVSKKLTKKK